MKSKIVTTIPVFNGAQFILETLESVARQTVQPDRVVVIDNCSTDNTQEIVRNFKPIKCEWRQNPTNLGLYGNLNKCLELAPEAEYINMLNADDVLDPKLYETMVAQLDPCKGIGMGFCLDERIDENNQPLTVSGSPSGNVEVVERDRFLREKAEIGNQACSGTLLKTNFQKAPVLFRLDIPMIADIVFYPEWGLACEKIVKVHQLLVKYRWHGSNTTSSNAVRNIQDLVLDEWVVMQLVEKMRGRGEMELMRKLKLKGLFAVRSGIKAKRFKEQGNASYSAEIVKAARPVSGALLWAAAQVLVETRDIVKFKLLGHRKHPKNVYG